MKTLPVLLSALLLAACSANPFVVQPSAPTSEVPMGHTSVTKQYPDPFPAPKADKLVPMPKPRPIVKKRHKAAAGAYETKTLGYSCATVRWASGAFSRKFLDDEGAARGISPAQKAEAARCLKA